MSKILIMVLATSLANAAQQPAPSFDPYADKVAAQQEAEQIWMAKNSEIFADPANLNPCTSGYLQRFESAKKLMNTWFAARKDYITKVRGDYQRRAIRVVDAQKEIYSELKAHNEHLVQLQRQIVDTDRRIKERNSSGGQPKSTSLAALQQLRKTLEDEEHAVKSAKEGLTKAITEGKSFSQDDAAVLRNFDRRLAASVSMFDLWNNYYQTRIRESLNCPQGK